MALKKFTANGVWNSGVAGRINGICVLKYSGSLGGGTLSVSSRSLDPDPDTGLTIDTPVPNAKLAVNKVDANGDVIQQLVFQTLGTISVTLTGATAPTAIVTVD